MRTHRFACRINAVLLGLFLAGVPVIRPAAAADLAEGFRNPPRACSLQCWWHWVDDCVTREGLTRDLKAMADAGISTAHVFAPKMTHLPATATVMSDAWIDLFSHAIREAKRNGIDLGFHNCPGWSSSGGPWISPENSMKSVVGSTRDVDLAALPAEGELTLPEPIVKCGFYRDLETFAFPVAVGPRLVSGGVPSVVPLRQSERQAYEVAYASPWSPPMAALDIATPNFYVTARIEALEDGKWTCRGERSFTCFKANECVRVIPLAKGKPSARWRFVFRYLKSPPWVPRKDIPVRSAALGDWPLAEAGLGSIPRQDIVRLGTGASAVPVRVLRERLSTARSATWRIVRVGYTTTGAGPSPASVRGLECDKLSRRGIDAHWAAMPARLLALPGAKDVVKYVIIDSYEVGGQNWTESLPEEFRRRKGRDLGDFLLAMVGYSVGSKAETDAFNADLRDVLRTLFAENYFDRFCELCHAAGVQAILEPYGGPFDTTRCSRDGDVLTGEFWLGRPVGDNLRAVVAAARHHGKNVIAAEAFTTEAKEGRWQITPDELRRVGDAAWTFGVNQLVLHSYLHQPYVDRRPGNSLQRHGTQLNVNTTWWPEMRAWTDYVRRGQFLLQYGTIARDRHDLADGRLEAIERLGANGERIVLVRNRSQSPFDGGVALGGANPRPGRVFDAVTGLIHPAETKDGATRIRLRPQESAFLVFGSDAPAVPARQAGSVIADLSSNWRIVSFDGLEAPAAPRQMETLASWHLSDDHRLRYFSGRARYERTGDFPAGLLDLGDVRELANVWVDGKRLGTLWQKPYRISVPAGHRLEVEVVNTWPNRLIGDAVRVANGETPVTWSNWTGGWSATDALRPAGLLGPVVLFAEETLETAKWQAAIDAASAAGGGRVTVPAGRHVTGQLYLRDNVELHLAEGAVLEGTTDRSQYKVHVLPFSEGSWTAVVMGLGVTNVAITGKGEIFGNGKQFNPAKVYGVCQEGLRPRGIFFSECRGIRLEDFLLRDAACWGIVLKCCDGMTARRVRIDSHANHNNDGFDIEAKNVLIEDCDVDAGDDAFCIKSNDPGFVVEHVTVRNCMARSHCNGYKLGTASHGTMRDIRIVHCRTAAPRRVYRDLAPMPTDLTRWYPVEGAPKYLCGPGIGAICVECVDGGVVEDILADDIEVSGFQVPIFVRGGSRTGRTCGTPPSDRYVLRNVTVSNVRGRAEQAVASSVTGVAKCRPSNVVLRDIDIVCVGEGANTKPIAEPGPETAGKYPEATMFRGYHLPCYGLYVDQADGVTVENARFTVRPGTVDGRKAIHFSGK